MTYGSRQFGRCVSSRVSRLRFLAWLVVAFAPTATSLGAQISLSAQEARRPRFLLDAGSARVPVDMAKSPSRERLVTLELQNVPLADALAEISRQSGIAIVYSDGVIPRVARVDVTARGKSVVAVLSDLLLDKGLDVVMRPDGSAKSRRHMAGCAWRCAATRQAQAPCSRRGRPK